MNDFSYDIMVMQECLGCEKISGQSCTVYNYPVSKWSNGKKCPLASHLEKKEEKKKLVDPIKASKRGR